MSPRRFLATVLVSSFGCYGLAAPPAGADPKAVPSPAASLRASVDAAVGHAALPRPKKTDGVRMTAADGSGGGGGGGGHVLLLVVGLAASAATAYFVIKETKKQTGQTQ